MPIFEYECNDCHCTFEQVVFSKEEEQSVKCPGCGGEAEKILSRFCRTTGGGLSTSCGPSTSKFT